MDTGRRAEVTNDDSSDTAFPYSIISSLKTAVFLIHSFMTNPNNQDPSSTSDLSSVVIDSSSSSSSSSFSASGDDTRIARTFQDPVLRTHELPSHHVRVTAPETSRKLNLSHQVLHCIIMAFQAQEMGRNILVLTVPIIAALVQLYNRDPTSLKASLILLLLSFGFTATWNGILLREMYPRASNVTEQLGVTLIFLALFGLMGCFLPSFLVWIPGLCFALCILPFILAAYFSRRPPAQT